jgi:hypothetical protein
LFENEEGWKDRKQLDPIRPAKLYASAQVKKRSHKTAQDLAESSIESLLAKLASWARATYELKSGDPNLTFK